MAITTETAGKQGKKNNIVAVFFIIFAVLMLFFLFYKWFYQGTKVDKIKDQEDTAVVVNEKVFNFTEPSTIDTEPLGFDNNNDDANAGFIGAKPIPSKIERKVSRSGIGGTLIVNKENQKLAQSVSNQSSDSKPFITSDKKDIYSASVDNFKATSALKSNYDTNLLLEQGTYIPCVMRQRLISTVGGQISCTVSSNVLSKSGNVVLIEKGTTIIGMYKSGGLKRGANQIFVIWQEARTSSNLVVNLDSGSTDALGANGLNGWVDQHFWERFGNAIVVSMISDASAAVSTQLQKSDTENYLKNSQEGGTNIASTIIEKMGDIEPTLYKNQGDKVGVFVARDIDFSSVYELRLNK
ncbi:type IV secretion system protein VirB10 [Orbus wheelerorum]|uniref:type IV secretion system protein VirB10 n=1 Tax=Orbus wheelerorum TaxID=3074111 RepID=UPI00370DE0BF